MTDNINVYRLGLDVVCSMWGHSTDDVLFAAQDLLDSGETMLDFEEWNRDFCEDEGMTPFEVEANNHVLCFLYAKLREHFLENGLEDKLLNFEGLDKSLIFEKIHDYELGESIAQQIRKIPFSKRNTLAHWFYSRFTS